MKRKSSLTYLRVFMLMACCMLSGLVVAQTNNLDGFDATTNTFNPNAALDSLKHSNKKIPKGMYVWTVDEKFGDIVPASVTLPSICS